MTRTFHRNAGPRSQGILKGQHRKYLRHQLPSRVGTRMLLYAKRKYQKLCSLVVHNFSKLQNMKKTRF